MYVPEAFQKKDGDELTRFIRENNFGILFSGLDGGLQANHLPFLFEASAGGPGLLRGHMAKANPQGRTLGAGEEVLVVFQGPHAYISPNWYEMPQRVPTWNYTAVHVYGRYQTLGGLEPTRQSLKDLVDAQEGSMKKPWKMESLSEEFVEKMVAQVQAFEIEITRLEGKWKLGQNHPKESRQKVVEALKREGGFFQKAIADLMGKD
ncbi:MAG: FMN-binding negative transcriptional regulator [bacterium]